MGTSGTAHEPSMEEILASIRQIISEDGDVADHRESDREAGGRAEAPARGMSHLAVVEPAEPGRSEHQATITNLHAGQPKSHPYKAVNVEPAPHVERPPHNQPVPSQHVSGEDRLLSDHANSAVAGSFSALAHTILAQNARTLEDLVGEMLRPMLREWLDDNLPNLVERVVQDEIQRVSRGRR